MGCGVRKEKVALMDTSTSPTLHGIGSSTHGQACELPSHACRPASSNIYDSCAVLLVRATGRVHRAAGQDACIRISGCSRVEVDGVGRQALEQDVVDGGTEDVTVARNVGVPCGDKPTEPEHVAASTTELANTKNNTARLCCWWCSRPPRRWQAGPASPAAART